MMTRLLVLLALAALCACTRVIVLAPSHDAGSDGVIPVPDAFVQDAGVTQDTGSAPFDASVD